MTVAYSFVREQSLARWLSFATVLHLFFVVNRIPEVVTLVVVLLCGWAIMSRRLFDKLPPRPVVLAIQAIALVIFFMFNGRRVAPEASISIAVLLASSNLVARLSTRAALTTLFVNAVLLSVAVSQWNSLWDIPILISDTVFLLLLAEQIHLYEITSYSLYRSILGSLKVALPIGTFVLLVFNFFPDIRPQGNGWGALSRSGMGDFLNPGDVGDLTLSDAVAFRVRFPEADPRYDDLYWRFGSYSLTEGLRWQRVGGVDTLWVLKPDKNDFIPNPATIREALTEPKEIDLLLRVPAEIAGDPALRTFVALFRQSGTSVESRLTWLGNYLAKDGFKYSLSPGKITSLQEFFFRRKAGFCEHYAATAAVLARLANLPARIAVGYWGGEWNPLTRVLTVRESSAHAWTEVWDQENLRWQRFDATSFVAPDVETAMRLRMKPTEWPWWRWIGAGAGWLTDGLTNRWQVLATVSAWFSVFVSDLELLDFALLFFCFAVFVFVLSVGIARRDNRKNRDELQEIFDAYCLRLKRLGIHRAPADTPLRLQKVCAGSAENSAAISQFTDAFVRLRYRTNAPPSRSELKMLRNMVRKIAGVRSSAK